MPLEPDLADQQLLADSFRRAGVKLTPRERVVGAAVAAGFLGACGAMWIAAPPGSFSGLRAALCVLVLALATRVRFDTPLGFTVPTQLAFVPLVFALPPALGPVAVACALLLASVPDLVRDRMPLSRLLHIPGNAWFAVGPAAVFVIAARAPSAAGPVLLLVALAAQFAVDFGVSTLCYAVAIRARLSSQFRELWVYGVDAGLSAIALVVAHATRQSPLAVLSLLPLLGLLALFARERHQRLEGLVELNNAYRGTALVLGDVVEADDGYTGQHSKSVVALSLEVAEQLGLTAKQSRNLEFAALLHDVGKVAIPKDIINNPGRLDAREWTIIRTHTLEGQKMLARVGGFMRDVGVVVRHHHERWDGGGYPDGLAGEAIPIESRIITCCDAWNAMRTDRSYRLALSHEAALAEINENCGTQFDPRVVQALIAAVGELPEGVQEDTRTAAAPAAQASHLQPA